RLPAIDAAFVIQHHGKERRSLDVWHFAMGAYQAFAFDTDLDRIVGNHLFLTLADGAQVYPAFVAKVHQVVDGQAEIRLDVMVAARGRPVGMVVPANVRNQFGVGALGVAHPDPQQAVLLFEREALDAGLLGNVGLAGSQRTGAAD